MNRNEFDSWWDRFGRVFPETAAWVNGLRTGKATLLDAWADVLADVPLQDAHEVTKRMLAGTDETLAAFDREKTPGHVRKLAWNLSQSRGEGTREPKLTPVRVDGPFPILRLYSELSDAREHGATQEQLDAITADFKSKHCTGQADYDGPRYHCATCLDSGMVTCWSDSAIMAMRDGGTAGVRECKYPTWGMLCSCRRGDRKAEGPMKNFARYNVAKCFLCPRGDATSEKNILAFEREYQTAKNSYFASRRESAFDAYNQQAAF